MTRLITLLSCLAIAVPVAAGAQTAVTPAVPATPPDTSTTPPEVIKPLRPDPGSTKGVLHPPPVDPGMVITPPRTNPQSTPVIPPPGSPGGKAGVVPK